MPRLPVSADGAVIVSSASSGVPATAVRHGGMAFTPDGALYVSEVVDPGDYAIPSDTPILVIGGDHAYTQWYGTNGNDGMAQMYLDQGITPYMAINTQDDAGESVGGANRMTWAQVRAVAAKGVEVTAHGSQHIQYWNRINTGIRITYAGATGTATVSITGTWPAITIASGTAAESFSFDTSNTSYNTLTKLKTAIEATGSAGTWTCRISPELTGSEDSNNLLNCGARTVKVVAASGTTPANSAFFAVGGGITIQYTGSIYKTAYVNITNTPTLDLYGDGVQVATFNLGTAQFDTLSELVTQISLVPGFVAKLMDNGVSNGGQDASNQTYITGTELSNRLNQISGVDVMGQERTFEMGLSVSYMVARQLQECVDTAATNSVTIKNFSASGADFFPWLQDGAAQSTKSWRGNPFVRTSVFPMLAPCDERPDYFYYQAAILTSHTIAQMQGWIDALCASPGHYSCWVIHQVAADGSSGYSLGTSYGTNSITEANFYTLIRYIKTKVDAGFLRTLTPEQFRIACKATPRPMNRIQNPTLANAGNTLTGFTSADGKEIGGWSLTTPASITACTVSSGTMTMTSNANTAVDILKQEQLFLPGRTYEFSCDMEMPTYTSGNGFYLRLSKRLTPMIPGMQPHTSNTVFGSFKHVKPGRVSLKFTVPKNGDSGLAFVRSLSKGPWDLSNAGNVAMKINLGAKGSIDNINVQGATPATTHANEIAAKLNAAIVADSAYAELQEYWTTFSAEDGYLIGRLPWRFGDNTGNISLDKATTNGGATPIVMNSSQSVTFSSSTGLLGTFTTDVGPTGTPVVFTAATALPTGISANTTYFTIRVSATTARFATSLANALAATAIAFTDAGTGAQVMYTGSNGTVRGPNFQHQNPSAYDYHYYAAITFDMTGTVRIRNPFIREVQYS